MAHTSDAAADLDIRKGLLYATHDGVELRGDFYAPKGGAPAPVLVAVHGGGWVAGAREQFANWGPYLAARGYALFTISYRLAKPGQPTFPRAVQDVLAAIQFVRGEAAGLNVDPTRVALFGGSAGAHLAALAGLGGRSPLFAKAYPQDAYANLSTDVKAVLGIYGVYDLVAAWQAFNIGSPRDNGITTFIGATPMEDRRVYFDASPVSYAIDANKAASVFLAWGDTDDLVDPRQQSEPFLLALKQAGFFARTCVVVGAGHYWASHPIDEPESHTGFLAPRLLRFLAERL